MLHGQIETLQQKKVEVEQHLERTEAWVEHLGKWSVHVHVEEDEDAAYIATMIVHVPNTAMVRSIFFFPLIKLVEIHYDPLMMQQKEARRKHPWVLPKKVAFLL